MGLETSHGCWSGSYSAFMRWRREIARAAGFPPLDLMDGFYKSSTQAFTADEAAAALPIKWDAFASDPLVKLLTHSDCQGEIAAEDCGAIADRLEGLLPLLVAEEDRGHTGNWHDKTSRFIEGLREAAAAGEAVQFR